MYYITTKHFSDSIVEYYVDWNDETVCEYVTTDKNARLNRHNMYRYIHEHPKSDVVEFLRSTLERSKT